MNSDWLPVLSIMLAGIGAFLFLIVSVSKMRIRHNNRRSDKLRKFAQNAGMTFQKNLLELEHILEPFDLIQKENAELEITNVLLSRSGELTLFLFDYIWETAGQDGELSRQSVILFDDFRFDLAHFSLRPRRTGDLLESLSGNRDVVPQGAPKFKKKYRLVSQTPRETYYLFTEKLIRFFLRSESICAEGQGTFFLIYESGKVVAPEKMQSFIEENLTGYHRLKEAVKESSLLSKTSLSGQ